MSLNSRKQLIRKLFLEGITSVKPDKLINSNMKLENDRLIINSRRYDLSRGRCYIVGFGKAVLDMALEAEKILKNKLHKGVLSLPQGLSVKPEFSTMKVLHGASSNLPDEKSLSATEEIVKVVMEASEEDLVLVLISGGGSALLAKPKPGITLSEKLDLIKRLTDSGADIKELNCVRKRVSDVKGGKLSRDIFPARYVSLVLSDIVGDPLELIASGPTVRNTEPPSKALNILRKYNLENEISQNILNAIIQDADVEKKVFANSYNIILGNNRIALEKIRGRATVEGYRCIILSNEIEENVEVLSCMYAELSKSIIDRDIQQINNILHKMKISDEKISEVVSVVKDAPSKVCLLLGGETVVTVRGNGTGGRNQELALRFSTHFDHLGCKYPEDSVVFLSGGTDGIDGPTDAAGAVSYSTQATKALQQGLNPLEYLSASNSYNYYRAFEGSADLIQIGHTGVNVMDLHILLLHSVHS